MKNQFLNKAIRAEKFISRLGLALVVIGIVTRFVKQYFDSLPQVITEKNEKKIRKILTPAQLERRNFANDLDGFPTNAKVES